jgi:hypothetical protein
MTIMCGGISMMGLFMVTAGLAAHISTKKIKRFMTWHVVDSQSTHVQPI